MTAPPDGGERKRGAGRGGGRRPRLRTAPPPSPGAPVCAQRLRLRPALPSAHSASAFARRPRLPTAPPPSPGAPVCPQRLRLRPPHLSASGVPACIRRTRVQAQGRRCEDGAAAEPPGRGTRGRSQRVQVAHVDVGDRRRPTCLRDAIVAFADTCKLQALGHPQNATSRARGIARGGVATAPAARSRHAYSLRTRATSLRLAIAVCWGDSTSAVLFARDARLV